MFMFMLKKLSGAENVFFSVLLDRAVEATATENRNETVAKQLVVVIFFYGLLK